MRLLVSRTRFKRETRRGEESGVLRFGALPATGQTGLLGESEKAARDLLDRFCRG